MAPGKKKARTSSKKKGKAGQQQQPATTTNDGPTLTRSQFPTWGDLSSFVSPSAPPTETGAPAAVPSTNGTSNHKPSVTPISTTTTATTTTTTETPTNTEECKSIFRRYKEATERFKEAVRRKVPSSFFPINLAAVAEEKKVEDSGSSSPYLVSVHALMDAVDYLAGTDQAIETEMMMDLKIAILARKKVAEYYMASHMGGSDDGHEKFIQVLSYCWGKLLRGSSTTTTTTATIKRKGVPHQDTNGESIANRFQDLALGTEEEEEEEEEEDIIEIPTVRPIVPKGLSLNELLRGYDRLDALAFLGSLDKCMGAIDKRYSYLKTFHGFLKTNQTDTADNGVPPSSPSSSSSSCIIGPLMQVAMESNFSIQLVASLEQQLIADYPHMNTVYRLLAVVFFPTQIEQLTDMVRQHHHKLSLTMNLNESSSSVSSMQQLFEAFKETHAVELLGDAMESSFRKENDPKNRKDTLAAEFAERWQVPQVMIQNMVMGTALSAKIETIYEQELTANTIHYYKELERRTGIRFLPHSWLRGLKFIGEMRCITSTIRRLQEFGSAVHFHQGKLQLTENGRPVRTRYWNEHDKKAKRIQHDLDQFLIGDALPTLVSMCLDGMLSIDLPQEGELLSFFSELKTYAKNPLKSLSWSTAFAVHLLLTSVLQVQGQDDIQTIGMEARNCFDRYMKQIDWVGAHSPASTLSSGVEGDRPQPWPVTMANLKKIPFLFRPHTFPAESTQADIELQTMLACWNPLCAGSFMLYTMYFCNLGGGVGMVDYLWQLRMVLHLFNAFRCHEVIKPGEVELLDWLHEQFLESKSIWEGAIPGKGQLSYRWRLAVGHTPTDARRQSEDSDRRLQHLREETVTPARSRAKQAHDVTRKNVRSLGAQDCASSYNRICLRDFSDLPDGSSLADLRLTAFNSQMLQHNARVAETLAAMDNDEGVLATNLVCLGEILDQFVVSFFRVFDFAPFFDKDEWLRTVKNSNGGARSSRRGLGRRATAWEESEDNVERQGTLLAISEMILPVLDYHPESHDYETIPTMAAFMKDYFNGVDPNNLMIFTPNTMKKTDHSSPIETLNNVMLASASQHKVEEPINKEII